MLRWILIFANVNLNILFEYIDSGIKFANNKPNKKFLSYDKVDGKQLLFVKKSKYSAFTVKSYK